MKSVGKFVRHSAMVAVVVILFAVGAATDPQLAQASQAVPFKASFTETGLSRTVIDSLHFTEQQTGQGNATHLGNTALSATITVDESPFPTTGCVSASRTVTLVAANGDQLFLTDTGTICPQADGSLPGTFAWTATGGSGRFRNAGGGGTIAGDNINGVITEQWVGTLSY
jgi:hypothetical protein